MSTPNILLLKRRLSASPLGVTIPVLSAGEIGYNEVNDVLYYSKEGNNVIDIAGPGAYTRLTVTDSVSGSLLSTIIQVSSDLSQSGGNLRSYVDSTFLPLSGGNVFGELTLTKGFSAYDNTYISGDLTITGNLSALGDITYIDTKVITTSSVSITNNGSGPALSVTQTGANDVMSVYDDTNIALKIIDGGNVGINTETPNERLTVVGNISADGDIYAKNGTFSANVEANTISVNGSTLVDSSQNITALGTLSVDNGNITSDGSGSLTISNSLYGTLDVSTIEGFIIDCGNLM